MNLAEYIKNKQQIKTKSAELKLLGPYSFEVLGAPYGGHNDGKDDHGEYFSENTEFMLEVGDFRPVVYYHGRTPRGANSLHPEVIGRAQVSRRDERGLWFDVALEEDSELARRVQDAAGEDGARASSGAINYLVRTEEDGEIASWPLAELSLFDTGAGRQPANQLAVVNVKSLFDNAGIEYPESFTETGEVAETGEKEKGDFIVVIHKR